MLRARGLKRRESTSLTSDPLSALVVTAEAWAENMQDNLSALRSFYLILADSRLSGDEKVRGIEALFIAEGVPYERGPSYGL